MALEFYVNSDGVINLKTNLENIQFQVPINIWRCFWRCFQLHHEDLHHLGVLTSLKYILPLGIIDLVNSYVILYHFELFDELVGFVGDQWKHRTGNVLLQHIKKFVAAFLKDK
jgi:hypothetical protein